MFGINEEDIFSIIYHDIYELKENTEVYSLKELDLQNYPNITSIDFEYLLKFENLETLKLSGYSPRRNDCQIEFDRAKSNSFSALKSLKNLELIHCIRNLPDEIFFGLSKLENLILCGNKNLIFRTNVFKDLKSLNSLDLSSCGITTFAEGFFSGLSNLKSLFLSNNNLIKLKSKAFQGLRSLRYLDLSYCKIEFIEDGFFSNFQKIEYLHLYNNRIENWKSNCFNDLKSLRYLDLSSCNLRSFEPSNLLNLEDLDLECNDLNYLALELFVSFKKLEKLFLDRNQVVYINREVVKRSEFRQALKSSIPDIQIYFCNEEGMDLRFLS